MDDIKTVREKLRIAEVEFLRCKVERLLLAKYWALFKVQANQLGQRSGSTPYEGVHVFPSYEAGDVQPLVEWIRLHKERGLPISSGLGDFLIDIVQGKKSRIPGKKKSTAVEQRDLRLAITMASFMHLHEMDYDAARAHVAKTTGRSEPMVGRAYNRFAMFFSK